MIKEPKKFHKNVYQTRGLFSCRLRGRTQPAATAHKACACGRQAGKYKFQSDKFITSKLLE